MQTSSVVAILNELLALEQRNLAIRLMESTLFVSHVSVESLRAIQRMAKACVQHGSRLAAAIERLGGALGPRIGDADSGDLHFQELHRLLPRLASDRASLVRKYALASERVGGDAVAGEAIAGILDCHRKELVLLGQLTGAEANAPG